MENKRGGSRTGAGRPTVLTEKMKVIKFSVPVRNYEEAYYAVKKLEKKFRKPEKEPKTKKESSNTGFAPVDEMFAGILSSIKKS